MKETDNICVSVYFSLGVYDCVCAHFLPTLALHQEAVAKKPGVLCLLFQFSSIQFSIVQFSFIAPMGKFVL